MSLEPLGDTGASGVALTDNNFLYAFSEESQKGEVAEGNFKPILFDNIPLDTVDGWNKVGSGFANIESGIYLVTYTAIILTNSIEGSAGGVAVQATINGAPVIGSHAGQPHFEQFGFKGLNVFRISHNFLLNYTAGDLLEIQFACTERVGLTECQITPGVIFEIPSTPGSRPLSASLSIVRIKT